MTAALTTKVITDYPHNESEVVCGRGTEHSLDILRDDLAFQDRHRFGDELTPLLEHLNIRSQTGSLLQASLSAAGKPGWPSGVPR